jgi:hypothetical protein
MLPKLTANLLSLQNSRKFVRSGKLARRKKRPSVRLSRSVSALPLRLFRPTRSKPPTPLTHPTGSHLPTAAVSVLSSLRSDTNPQTTRSPASTVDPPAVEWCTRTMDRWPILPTTLTLHTRADRCTRNVSNVATLGSTLWNSFRQGHPRRTCPLIQSLRLPETQSNYQ